MENINEVKILFADDHKLVRQGIISILTEDKELNVIGEAADGLELKEKFLLLKPDVILADIEMPLVSGPRAVGQLISEGHDVNALFLSIHQDEDYRYCCHKYGGKGLIGKTESSSELRAAIKTVALGNIYYAPGWTDKRLRETIESYEAINDKNFTPPCIRNLSRRELEVFKLIREGKTSKQISVQLNLGKRTVDSYRSSMMNKLGCNSLVELMKYTFKDETNKIV